MSALKEAQKLYEEFQRAGSIEAMTKLTEFMALYEGEDEIVPLANLDISEFEEEERYLTGIPKLDGILDGFRSNQLIAVSAPSKAGKTQFCMHLARALPNPTMFLFEETAQEVLYKYHKKGIELPPNLYALRSLTEYSVDYVYRKMIEAWAKYDSRIFFIDHLHYLIPNEGNEHATYKIKRIMQDLKQFAKRHGFTIFIVAHISHQSYDQPPGIEDIRDSSFIAQYADTTLMLWRETYNAGAREHKKLYNYTNNLLINVALNRKINFSKDYNTGLVDLTFNTDTWSYEPSDWYTEWIETGSKEVMKSKNLISQLYKA
jgi:replicative DNA helicase